MYTLSLACQVYHQLPLLLPVCKLGLYVCVLNMYVDKYVCRYECIYYMYVRIGCFCILIMFLNRCFRTVPI